MYVGYNVVLHYGFSHEWHEIEFLPFLIFQFLQFVSLHINPVQLLLSLILKFSFLLLQLVFTPTKLILDYLQRLK